MAFGFGLDKDTVGICHGQMDVDGSQGQSFTHINFATPHLWCMSLRSAFLGIPERAPLSFSVFCFKLYFIDYAITVVLISPLRPSSTQYPSLPQAIYPHHCSRSWVMHVSSLATPFPILCFTSPWLFCNYLFVLLNPLTSSPIAPNLPIWQPSKERASLSLAR